MKVMLYGRLAEAIGRQVKVDAQAGCSVGQIRNVLATSYPAAADALHRSRAFIADSLVADERIVDEAEAIEFLPPVSGG